MATTAVSFNIDNSVLPGVITAFQNAYPGDWAAAQAAGLTGAQFARRKVIDYVRAVYTADQPQRDAAAALAASLATITANANSGIT